MYILRILVKNVSICSSWFPWVFCPLSMCWSLVEVLWSLFYDTSEQSLQTQYTNKNTEYLRDIRQMQFYYRNTKEMLVQWIMLISVENWHIIHCSKLIFDPRVLSKSWDKSRVIIPESFFNRLKRGFFSNLCGQLTKTTEFELGLPARVFKPKFQY